MNCIKRTLTCLRMRGSIRLSLLPALLAATLLPAACSKTKTVCSDVAVSKSASIILPRAHASAEQMLAAKSWATAYTTAYLGDSLPDNPKSPPKPPTPDIPNDWRVRAQLAWSPDYLFVWVESYGPPPMETKQVQGGPLHGSDVYEVFIDVTGEQKQIVEIQADAQGQTHSFYHIWSKAPRYPANHVDESFYVTHHARDNSWQLDGVEVRNSVETIQPGKAYWTLRMAIPMQEILKRSGLEPKLSENQTLRLNVLRYAYVRQNDRLVFRQYNLVPTRHGCPHQSPMAAMTFITAK